MIRKLNYVRLGMSLNNVCMLDEKERNPKSQSANVRTLPMAIIPGEQVCRIIVNEDRLPKDVLQYINGECEQVEKNIDSVIANNEDARNL